MRDRGEGGRAGLAGRMREVQAELRAAETAAERAMDGARDLYGGGRVLGAFLIWGLLQAERLCRAVVGWHSRRLLRMAGTATGRREPPA